MKSRLLDELVPQVKLNCNISDSQFWGYYSVCGLLLRLRELYRFEHGVKPWDTHAEGDIATWIGDRESLWEEISELDLMPLKIGADTFGPFDVEEINQRLMDSGLLYGAGYGLYGKPVFYLAELASRKVLEGYDVFLSGREYARDLSIHPAMMQHLKIYARKDICELLLWEKFEELKAKKRAGALAIAFSAYGIAPSASAEHVKELIKTAAESELSTYIHHELGEAVESEKVGEEWNEMLSAVLSSKASMFARAVMDTMADASERGMLKHIINQRKTGSLAFYMTFLGGYRRMMAPNMVEAFEKFSSDGEWTHIESARRTLYVKARRMLDNIMGVFRADGNTRALIEAIQREITLLQP